MKVVGVECWTGDKAKSGTICFDTGKLGVFVTYCGNCHCKLVMSLEESEQFANKYKSETRKFGNRQLLSRLKKIENIV